jgi:hypothetical protein
MAPGAAVVEMTVLFMGMSSFIYNRYTIKPTPGKVNRRPLSAGANCAMIKEKKRAQARSAGPEEDVWTAFGRA